jgi:hypothetical protein
MCTRTEASARSHTGQKIISSAKIALAHDKRRMAAPCGIVLFATALRRAFGL